MNLGCTSERWKDLYLSGTAQMTGLNVANNASITADGYVTGTWLQSTATYSISASTAGQGIALFHGGWLYYTSTDNFKKDLKLVDNDSDQTIKGSKAFTGQVGNTQSESGVYLGLDTNTVAPNANIAITSANSAAYIDMGKPNHDYDFRLIKWDSNNGNVAQMCYNTEDGGASANITIPRASGTLALTSDLNDYFKFLKYKLLSSSSEELQTIHLVDEGIENLFKKKIIEANNMNEFIEACISKRYTYARIKRTIVHILVNTKKEFAKKFLNTDITYIRLLGVSNKGQEYLNSIRKDIEVPLLSKFRGKSFPVLQLEKQVNYVYNQVKDDRYCNEEYEKEHYIYPIRKD
jgi:hypothetical protein